MKKNYLAKMILMLLMLGAAAAWAQPPLTMNYQGTLRDGSGVPVADGNYDLTFRIWNAAAGGAVGWTETRTVTVDGGIFNVVLGAVNPLNLPFDNQYWLSVQVGMDPELAPRIPLTSVPYAMNVADGKVVTSLNGLTDDVNIVAGANISVNTAGPNITISGTGAVTDNDWAVAGGDMTTIPAGNVGIGVVPGAKLDVGGTIRSGTDLAAGELQLRVAGSPTPSFLGGDYGGLGSEFSFRAEDGGTNLLFQPDVDGEGGFFQVNRSSFSGGLVVDGNYAGSNSTRMSILGSGSSTIISADAAGNAAVQLPSDAVAAAEMLDEPGLASAKSNQTSPYDFTTSLGTITSRTIVCPADGYVFVSASFEIDISHSNGTTAFSTVGVSNSAGVLPNNQDLSFYMPAGAASGAYLTPGAATGVFAVSAGSNTFYLLGYKNSAGVDVQMWDAQLTALYFPTAYGTVTETDSGAIEALAGQDNDAPGRSGPTTSELAAEQAQSEQDAQQRVDRELSEMRQQLQDLQRQLDDLNRISAVR